MHSDPKKVEDIEFGKLYDDQVSAERNTGLEVRLPEKPDHLKGKLIFPKVVTDNAPYSRISAGQEAQPKKEEEKLEPANVGSASRFSPRINYGQITKSSIIQKYEK